ncbi:MAG: LysR family transcriptional regulator [Shinella sp.]|nr:LysR family transcriptional regulator [Shinella sp.]
MDRKAKRDPSIELRHLRYFLAAVEYGSFRKAGAALGIQESAISRRIRDLEDRLGAALFHRYNGGVRLTFAGERFLPRARQIVRHICESIRDIASIGRSEDGRVRIGIFSSIASGFLAELLGAYQQNHADVQIELIDGEPADHVVAVRQLRLDIAFVTGTRDWPECDSAELWCERVFAVLPEDHILTGKEELDWHDLTQEIFIVSEAAQGQEIHDYLVQRLAALGHRPEIRSQHVGRDNLLPLVALGRGLTLTSEATTAAHFPGIAYRPMSGETLPFGAVWSPKNDNPAFRRLLSMAKVLARRS